MRLGTGSNDELELGTVFQRLDDHGIWSNGAWLPKQGTRDCTARIDTPGTWRPPFGG